MSRKGDADNSSIYSLADDKLKPDYKNFVVCPYDKHHVVLACRLATHLVKCSANHPGNRMVRCPFNSTHVLQASFLSTHVLTCPNLKDLMHFTNKETFRSPDQMAGRVEYIYCQENWNDEPETKVYDPQEHCSKNILLRSLVGGTPSQRKEFRETERKKFKELMECNEL
ncbi:gametocyte-specific factor 1 homolog [Drosophila innubila]|uniref:gametocyte-specific factor 1 homolog n=1 Tax=Drosophila innubila TaxID=198719 RepID=UPI00148E0698|nr:gametocyte-specific factor 1 homolog [Drosophila innubila]XP_034478109.1 gametocyte-specific factor 1 homolog [Drosophila innubila]